MTGAGVLSIVRLVLFLSKRLARSKSVFNLQDEVYAELKMRMCTLDQGTELNRELAVAKLSCSVKSKGS